MSATKQKPTGNALTLLNLCRQYKKYKEEYSSIVLEREYTINEGICEYHLESIQYQYEFRKAGLE
jgi:hypothetical protein